MVNTVITGTETRSKNMWSARLLFVFYIHVSYPPHPYPHNPHTHTSHPSRAVDETTPVSPPTSLTATTVATVATTEVRRARRTTTVKVATRPPVPAPCVVPKESALLPAALGRVCREGCAAVVQAAARFSEMTPPLSLEAEALLKGARVCWKRRTPVVQAAARSPEPTLPLVPKCAALLRGLLGRVCRREAATAAATTYHPCSTTAKGVPPQAPL